MPESHQVRTMCPMNCHPTLCGMVVTLEDGKLVDVRGDKENPDSKGFLCVRGQASREIIGNEKRILYPMIRAERGSSDWRRIGWDEALDRIATGIKAVTPDSVALWPGHGVLSNDFGIFAHTGLAMRLACMYGMQLWDASMVCWGLGGFGIGLTGAMEINTKEDMAAHADMIILWGSDIASQPTSAHHILTAKSRGAKIIVIDVRFSHACKLANEYFIVKPGTDAALALAMMHVIEKNDLHDAGFIAGHTIGFEALREHLQPLTPEWAQAITGIDAGRITRLALDYANTERAMIMLSGSSMYKDEHGWQSSRAISCLPPLTGKLGKPGTGFGVRHGGMPHGFGLSDIVNFPARPPGNYVPNQMSAILDLMESGGIKVFVLLGSNVLSSFADAQRIENGLKKTDLIVHHDLFMNETARNYADIVLPATAWLEDTGCKATAGHVYLMDKVLEPPGEARSMSSIIKSLAERLDVRDFYPWQGEFGHIDAVLDHPAMGHMTIDALREHGGLSPLNVSPVAHIDHRYRTPSGKVEFYSERAAEQGLPPLPGYQPRAASDFPLELRFGRALTHFHAFYDHGRALPALHKLEKGPTLLISIADAGARGLENGADVRIHNERGACSAIARITDDVPPGTVWMHDGWPDVNRLTSGKNCLPDGATKIFPFGVGQSAYDAWVEVSSDHSKQPT